MNIEKRLEKKLLSKKVIEAVEEMVSKEGLTYIEAIIEYCEQNSLEIETVSRTIRNNSIIKSKVQEEAEELNMIEKSGKLPI